MNLKKQRVIFLLSLFLSSSSLSIQTYGLSEIDLTSTNNINIAQIKNLSSNNKDLNKFFVFNNTYHIKTISSQIDNQGIKHIRYQQYYQDLPIFNYQITHHTRPSKNNLSASKSLYIGKLLNDIKTDPRDPTKELSENQAIDKAVNVFLQDNSYSLSDTDVLDKISTKILYPDLSNNTAHIAYEIEFFAEKKGGGRPTNPHYIINAQNGEVLKYFNNLKSEKLGTGPGGNKKIGKHIYGTDGLPKFDVRVTPRKECFMTSNYIRTIDLNLKGTFPGTDYDQTYHFSCFLNDAGEINGAYSPVNDAHYNAQKVMEFFDNWYSENPLAIKPVVRANYAKYCVNAFWYNNTITTGSGNTSSDTPLEEIDMFCGGAEMLSHPLVSLDVIAHELAHGITEKTSDLFYDSIESGGLNESFSDMTAQAADYFSTGKNSWHIGDKIMIKPDVIRYMDDPERDDKSISNIHKMDTLPPELRDPHYTSGIFNKAFYLLATTPNWDVRKAYNVFYHANKYYWTPNTNFIEASQTALFSAEDLGYKMADLINVFEQVGITCSEEKCEKSA